MRITALDIHQKEFSHGMRGYRDDEVDDFLDVVAAEFDRISKENEEWRNRFREVESKLAEFEGERNAINSALLIAQRSADEITLTAEAERDKTLFEAEKKAAEIIHEALAQKRELLAEIKRLKADEERFRKNVLRVLEDTRATVTEVRLSDSLMAALSEREDSYAAAVAKAESEARNESRQPEPEPFAPQAPEQVEPVTTVVEPVEVETLDRTQEMSPVSPVFTRSAVTPSEPVAPAPAVEPAAQLTAEPEASQLEDLAKEADAFFAPETAQASVADSAPAKTSQTQGLFIGEVGNDAPVDTTLIEPREYELPGGDRWGDRDDDLDIEEID